MDMTFISNLLLASVRMATPLIFLALAELYSQRAGLVHIGLEGLAAIGSLTGFLVSLITGSPFVGVLAGAAVGILVNMIYAYATIHLCAEQIVYAWPSTSLPRRWRLSSIGSISVLAASWYRWS